MYFDSLNLSSGHWGACCGDTLSQAGWYKGWRFLIGFNFVTEAHHYTTGNKVKPLNNRLASYWRSSRRKKT